MSKFKMYGVIPPMVTPFKENGEVDLESLDRLVAFLKKEVDGLFINGSYGSGALMSEDERKLVAEKVIKNVKTEIPVIVHIGTTDSATAARLAAHAKTIGANAVSAVGPFYFQHNPDQVCEYYKAILNSAGNLPVYVYNNPKFQGYNMSFELIEMLKTLGISGIKDATFDILTHANYIRKLKDENFDVALGTEAMWLSACALGCEAFIPGLGNVFPQICKQMHNEGMAGNFSSCKETQFKVNQLRDVMYLARSTQLAIYAMLDICGVIRAYPRSPFIPASDHEKTAISAQLKLMGMI